jgi:hypothetical protein
MRLLCTAKSSLGRSVRAMLNTMEIIMKMKKQALLLALTSALALGTATASFAQDGPGAGSPAVQNRNGAYVPQYAPNTYAPSGTASGQEYVPGYGNIGAGSGPSNE